jgi:ubiquinone/menaquinone biosynthesis C-methylase UbiE
VKSAIGIDQEPKAIERANQLSRHQGFRTLRFIEADMKSLPFDDSEFDAVFFRAVLYHLDPTALTRTLAEARRVLAADGLIGVSRFRCRRQYSVSGKRGLVDVA